MTSKRQLWNTCLGNLFEHYDTALFGFLSPFLAPLIFPGHDPITALILTYAIIPLGMLARPIGALVFGHIGDIYGRERSLFLTLAGMAVVSGCIAMSPTYFQAGIFAPILFCLGRALQNFFAAGQTMGGAIYILEKTSDKHHDLLSSLYGASAMGGHLLASLGVYFLSTFHIVDEGWRFLYVFGCLTAIFGCLLRKPSSVRVSGNFFLTITHLKRELWLHRKSFLAIVVCSGFAHATYSIALILMNGFIPLVTSVSKEEVMKINTYLLVLDFCALPLFGWIASKVSREKFMLCIAVGTISLAMPLLLILEHSSLLGILGVRVAFVMLGVAFFAPFHAWVQQLIPQNYRYVIISFGYAIGSQLLGSPTAAISLWAFQKTNIVSSISWYWIILGIAASLSLILMRSKTSTKSIRQIS